MATDDKIYYPQTIDNEPFPNQVEEASFASSQTTGNQTLSTQKIDNQPLPTKRVAVELLSSALNTRTHKILVEFEFTEHGAISVGKYENGVSGDLRLTPNGLVARNKDGTVTIGIDGTTGDAIFSGTIQAGTLIGGQVAVGDGDILIDGEEKRMVFYDPDNGLASIIIGNA